MSRPLLVDAVVDFTADPLACEAAAVRAEAEGYDGVSVPDFARNPMTTAMVANDVQLVSGGRFELGLGSQVRAHIERRFGMPWGRPAARMEEYVGTLRAIWGGVAGRLSLNTPYAADHEQVLEVAALLRWTLLR